MSVIGSNIIAGASGTVETGYQISRSLRFNSADTAWLSRTTSFSGTTNTWSFKVKRSALGSIQAIFGSSNGVDTSFSISFNASDQLELSNYALSYTARLITTQVFRDVGAWYDIVVVIDTTNATAGNRLRLYVNGVRVTAFSTETQPTQNASLYTSTSVQWGIGREGNAGGYPSNIYLADFRLIDGQALDATSFGETDSATGVWVPKAYTGTFGTNGFWLKFDDNSGTTSTTLGKDSSGNGNNWTPNNFSVTAGAGNDSLVDSPTNYGTDTGAGGEVRGNYCTWNAINNNTTLANGNLQVDTASNTWKSTAGTMSMPSGKWYFEATVTAFTGTLYVNVGVARDSAALPAAGGSGGWDGSANGYVYYNGGGLKYNNGTGTAYGASYTTNDVIGVAWDADAGTLTFYKNGVSQGAAWTGLTGGPFMPVISVYATCTVYTNFGQRPFAYTAPSGFKALNTQNLPTPAIGASASTLANKYFDVALYTGTGATQSIASLNFQPDFVWLKSRSNGLDHKLTDAVRGTTKGLISNSTAAETTDTNGLTAFNSNGFTIGSDATYNTNAATYVSWDWKANGAGSSNNAGSITSTVSANTTAGISIVTWTGNATNATIGHGLGAVPKMMLIKWRSGGGLSTDNWTVYHEALGNTKALRLNTTDAAVTSSTFFNNTSPTSTVFTMSSGNGANLSGSLAVAYCFAEVAGFSKIGSYTGNGSTDGPFVYCGFRPKFILVKNSNAVQGWAINDTARSTYNLVDAFMTASSSGAESSVYAKMDILSNGFKVRDADALINGGTNTMIFIAFAENPFNYSRAR